MTKKVTLKDLKKLSVFHTEISNVSINGMILFTNNSNIVNININDDSEELDIKNGHNLIAYIPLKDLKSFIYVSGQNLYEYKK